MHPLINSALYMIGYGLVSALVMSVALGLLIKVWDWITPIDEWEELRKGNIAVAIVVAAVILGFAIVVSVAVAPTNTPQMFPP